jgi:hypothetical protein
MDIILEVRFGSKMDLYINLSSGEGSPQTKEIRRQSRDFENAFFHTALG